MKAKRINLLKVRLTDDEMKQLTGPPSVNGKPERNLSRLARARLFAPGRHASHPADCKHCRLLASAVNNLNVIARRTLDLAKPDTAMEVIAHLAALEREIRRASDTMAKR